MTDENEIRTDGADAVLEMARRAQEALALIPEDFDPDEDRRTLIEAGILYPDTGEFKDEARQRGEA